MFFPRLIALSEIAWAQPAHKLEGNSFYRQVAPLFRRMDMMKISYRIPDLGGFYKTNAFIDSATITLQSQLPSTQIRYTTDGSMPEKNSLDYTHPITVNQSTNFRFRTFRPDGSPSDCVDVKYIKDTYANSEANAIASEKGLIATCTPVSVLPAPVTEIPSFRIVLRALLRHSCILTPLGCICQPW